MTQSQNIENRALRLCDEYSNSDPDKMRDLIQILISHVPHYLYFFLEQELMRLEEANKDE